MKPPKVSVSRSRKDRAPRLPENLPVVEEVIEPEPVKAQPEQWRCIGQEVSEQLDYEPARFLRRRIIRKKYVSRVDVDLAPVIAPLPERLLDRSLPAPGLLAQILVAKYCDHLPLYRQEQIYAQRHQVQIPRQTLARWVELAADWLKPIYEQIRTGVMAGGYVQVDETPIELSGAGTWRTRQGYLWTAGRPKGDVFFHWETSRATACLEKVVPATFTGTIAKRWLRGVSRLRQRTRPERLPWPAAGRMSGGSFTRPVKLAAAGGLAAAANPTPLSRRSQFTRTPGWTRAACRRSRQSKPPRSSNAWKEPCSDSRRVAVTCPKRLGPSH